MNRFKTVFLALLAIAFVTACNEGGSDVKDEAREAIETTEPANTAANPNNNTAQPVESTVPTGPTTTMSFDEVEFDFGTIDEGEVVSHIYKFTNTGEEPLIISSAKGSCGCTVPKRPREPIAPGDEAAITVEFNSKGKKGQRTQKVTITANTNPPQSFLTLKGQVTPKDAAQ